VPAIVVPFLYDQFYWGRRVAELGVGPEPVPFASLSAGRLAEAIRMATEDGEMQARARRLGSEIREEDGIASAVRILESVASG
jgi:UDP:flavonoid glycosyltransferase YjiC (YdhE family)